MGNSKLRVSKNTTSSNSSSNNTSTAESKVLRASVPRSAGGIILDQVLAVSRGFLSSKYFKAATPSTAKSVSVQERPNVSRRAQMVVVASNPLFARIPVRISYQTLNAEALLQKSPRMTRVG